MMCQYRLILGGQCSTPVSDGSDGGSHACVDIWRFVCVGWMGNLCSFLSNALLTLKLLFKKVMKKSIHLSSYPNLFLWKVFFQKDKVRISLENSGWSLQTWVFTYPHPKLLHVRLLIRELSPGTSLSWGRLRPLRLHPGVYCIQWLVYARVFSTPVSAGLSSIWHLQCYYSIVAGFFLYPFLFPYLTPIILLRGNMRLRPFPGKYTLWQFHGWCPSCQALCLPGPVLGQWQRDATQTGKL